MDELQSQAEKVLKSNDRGTWIAPSVEIYPHQWFWDSCFIAIGLRHLSVERAQLELESLLRGQWENGMFPNMIFDNAPQYKRDRELWRSWVNPYAPDGVATSGVTQPPMVAEAVLRVGQKLKMPERRSWFNKMYPHLVRYHEWLYVDRDPHQEGLAVLIHPYESGLDNSPPWVSELHKHSMPLWVSVVKKLHLDSLGILVRRDTKHVPPNQRMDNIESLAYWAVLLRLRRKAYNTEAILSRSLFMVEDLAFNCILIRANDCLAEVAKTIGKELPPQMLEATERSRLALDKLWDETSGQYFSRSFIAHKLIEEPTIATLMPLYAGCVSKDRAARLVELLNKRSQFKTNWLVPSVPLSSSYFDPVRYWQGPTWVNTNWFIIEGLKRYGYHEEAEKLKDKTLKMVSDGGFSEYFNPLTGQAVGEPNFSWTAALTIDLLKN